MPEYNAIQNSRLESWVRKLLGVRNGGIMPTVAPELGAAINLPSYLDGDLLAGYVPWGAAGTIGAVAGQNGQLTLLNSFPSELVLVRFGCSPSGSSAFDIATGPGLAGAPVAPAWAGFRDTRRLIGSFPLNANGLQLSQGTAVIASPPAGHFRVAGLVVNSNGWQVSPWFVVTPGAGIVLVCTAVNIQVSWSIEGYWRSVEDELTA